MFAFITDEKSWYSNFLKTQEEKNLLVETSKLAQCGNFQRNHCPHCTSMISRIIIMIQKASRLWVMWSNHRKLNKSYLCFETMTKKCLRWRLNTSRVWFVDFITQIHQHKWNSQHPAGVYRRSRFTMQNFYLSCSDFNTSGGFFTSTGDSSSWRQR